MPASTGTAGRAGSPRAVQATASASASRSTWIFTGSCLLLLGSETARARLAYYLIVLGDRDKNVAVVGTVDAGDSGRCPSPRRFRESQGLCAGGGGAGDELWTGPAPGRRVPSVPPPPVAVSARPPQRGPKGIHSLVSPH